MEWSENLSVGIKEIDEQHKKLVSQINALHDGMRSGQGKDTLEKTLGELADYSQYHFKTEEKYMEKFGYPDFEKHREEHDAFVVKVADFQNAYSSGKLGLSIDVMNSLMEEAIASSIIEGAATTRKAAKEMLRKGKKPSNKSEQMVINNYRAMQYIMEHRDEPLTTELILAVHRIVTENTLEDSAVGRFRDNDDIVVADPVNGTVHHIPPVYTKVPEMIEELCRFANQDDEGPEKFIHPIVKGVILHFLIGYIHPFEDGNGRCARSIFYWYVFSRGYWLFEYMPISRIILKSRKDYSIAYLHTEYDEMDLTYFLLYNIRCIEKARSGA